MASWTEKVVAGIDDAAARPDRPELDGTATDPRDLEKRGTCCAIVGHQVRRGPYPGATGVQSSRSSRQPQHVSPQSVRSRRPPNLASRRSGRPMCRRAGEAMPRGPNRSASRRCRARSVLLPALRSRRHRCRGGGVGSSMGAGTARRQASRQSKSRIGLKKGGAHENVGAGRRVQTKGRSRSPPAGQRPVGPGWRRYAKTPHQRHGMSRTAGSIAPSPLSPQHSRVPSVLIAHV